MRRQISFEFVGIILVSLIVFIIGASLIARNALNDATDLNLDHYLDIIEIEANQTSDYDGLINQYQNIDDYLRITIISPEGVVLADSSADELDNHINRPEIRNIGESYIRDSDTLNMEMMYKAVILNSGDYLRIAIPTASILQFLNDFIGLSLVVGLIILALSILTSSVLIRYSLKPMQDMKDILKDVNQGKYSEIIPLKRYDEMNEFIKEINQINQMISSNIASLTSEKHKTDFLLNHMKQGICVLDNHKRIILLNKTLKDIYRFNIDININKDFRFLFREEELQNAIEKVYLKQENAQLIIEKDARYYSISITFSKDSWQDHQSVIIIYTDITSIRQIEILKRDFFVNASHELKSPLTSIMGSSELITQGMVDDKAGMIDLIERIHHEAKRMNHLVMDMLLLSELENQNQVKEKQTIQVEAVLNDVINNLSFLIKEQNTSIIQNIHIKTLRFNAEDFYQMIKNIIENSIKYGQSNGHVWINIDQDDSYYIIDIKDDGIGIPKDDQERIFERFYRVDKARSRNSGGTGLGLSIVKHIILNYHGQIALDSQTNKGTTVTIKIPK